MGAVRVDGRDAPVVESVEEMLGRFTSHLLTLVPLWKSRLMHSPECLPELETDVHSEFARGADFAVAGLLALVMGDPAFLDKAEQSRQAFATPLRQGRSRQIAVRLLGGLVIWVTSLYCAARRFANEENEDGAGAYIELMQFGFGKGVSPGLESTVARQAALCPSFEFATQELQRRGVKIDVKTVRRIANQCGDSLLSLREHELELFRAGTLPMGTEFVGKSISVQFDGGRTRLRGPLVPVTAEDSQKHDADDPGRSRKQPKHKYDSDWREPKLVTIFEHDEEGKMKKETLATIDGTFGGPDALAEIIAMHLHRLGAAKAASVTFVADGAPWIWDRVPVIIEKAGLKNVPIHQVLDCCHATHHISLALKAMGLTGDAYKAVYKLHRTNLRNGHWRQVVDELTDFAKGFNEIKDVKTEIAYLTKHGEAGRLMYPSFRAKGIPLGSGSIESNIRRVINLRLKGSGIFWTPANAEAMLQLRAQVISNRWDERMIAMRNHHRIHGKKRPPSRLQKTLEKIEAKKEKATKP